MTCAWCGGEFVAKRSDAVTCSKRCRQARSRFGQAVSCRTLGQVSSSAVRRFAFADPPYPGRSARYYGDHHDYAGEVDHGELIGRLAAFDGWALCTAADALQEVLASCPPGVRVAAWVRGSVASAGWYAVSSWEPVIYFGARPVDPSSAAVVRRDSLVHGVTPYSTVPSRVIGAKPAPFSRWVFELLGALPGDDLVDLFPGSGLVARAWAGYSAQGGGITSIASSTGHGVEAVKPPVSDTQPFAGAASASPGHLVSRGLDGWNGAR